jgi:hypothetical protein
MNDAEARRVWATGCDGRSTAFCVFVFVRPPQAKHKCKKEASGDQQILAHPRLHMLERYRHADTRE